MHREALSEVVDRSAARQQLMGVDLTVCSRWIQGIPTRPRPSSLTALVSQSVPPEHLLDPATQVGLYSVFDNSTISRFRRRLKYQLIETKI